ncbi:metalloprotease TIKI2-like [Panonychus citri]|uniref:metalloprotease TIKI2-like n=1 Tax=Panonychus citri TaxID=50023 RepID=UPI002307D2F8|nr:metalloprotease TIKI2-like [Panonychus citri]
MRREIKLPLIFIQLAIGSVILCDLINHVRASTSVVSDVKSKVNPFLWQVTSNETIKPSYLFGTIHVAYTRVWEYIPSIVKRKFRESDNIYFELDLLEPSVTIDMDLCRYLPDDKRLSDILPHELYSRLVDHLKYTRTMMPIWLPSTERKYQDMNPYDLFRAKTFAWNRKHAIWTLLMIDSLTEQEIRSHGTSTLDLYLAQEAQRLGKKTGAVENVEDQCEPLNNINLNQVIFALNMTLNRHESIRKGNAESTHAFEDLIERYKNGNIDTLLSTQEQLPPTKDAAVTAQQIEEYWQEKFIKERNQKMAKKIISLLNDQSDESFFFAFGVAHFLGDHSIIDLLRTAGYSVERVENARESNGRSNYREQNMQVNPKFVRNNNI